MREFDESRSYGNNPAEGRALEQNVHADADEAAGPVEARRRRESMALVERMKSRWGVGPGGVIAILAAFSLAGLTTLRLKGPVIGLMFSETTPGWLQWTVYLIVMLPIYQVLLLGYGTLLGQFDFFWTKMKAIGRLVSGRPVRTSN